MPAGRGTPTRRSRSKASTRRLAWVAAPFPLLFILGSCYTIEPEDRADKPPTTSDTLVVPEPFDSTAEDAWSTFLPDDVSYSASGDWFVYVESAYETGTAMHGVHLIDLLSGEEIWAAEIDALSEYGELTGTDWALPVTRFVGENVAIFQQGTLPLTSDLGRDQNGFSVTTLAGENGSVLESEFRSLAYGLDAAVRSLASMVVRVEDSDQVVLETVAVREDGTLKAVESGGLEVPCQSSGTCPVVTWMVEAAPGQDVYTYVQDVGVQAEICTTTGAITGSPLPDCASGFGTRSWTSQSRTPQGASPDRASLLGVSAEIVVGQWEDANGQFVVAAIAVDDGSVLATISGCRLNAPFALPVLISPSGRYAVTESAVFDLQQGTGQCVAETVDRPGLTLTVVDDSGRVWGLPRRTDSGTTDSHSAGEIVVVDVATGAAEPLEAAYIPMLLTSTGMGVFLATDDPPDWVLVGYPSR